MLETLQTTLSGVDWIAIAGWTSAIAFILVGLAGTVIPALPGIPMIFAGA